MRPEPKRVVPSVDALYWAMILAATALGEKLGDLVSMTFGLGYGPGAALLVGASLAAILVQLALPVGRVPLYWAVVVLTSTAGTTMADLLTRTLGLGYAGGSLVLATLIVAISLLRRQIAPTRSLIAPMSRPLEALYWAEMLVAGTLGTASGDFLANDAGFGFAGAALLLVALLASLGGMAAATRWPRQPLYWTAILVGDPLGATIGDALDKPDCLDLGIATAVAILACVLAAVVAFSMRRPGAVAPVAETCA